MGSSHDWRIVSTSNEATHVVRQLLHGSVVGDTASRSLNKAPILFKLHGHGEHLLTMAIAGQDKEVYSSLSLPVDSLHEVYTSAEVFLKRSLQNTEEPIFWHVVGHSLGDAMLRELIVEAMHGRRQSVLFFIGGPKARTEVPKPFGSFKLGKTLHPIPLTARQYMARLRMIGKPPSDLADLREWIEEISADGG
jgi:hypothetical protein